MPKTKRKLEHTTNGGFTNIDELRQHDIKGRLARVEGHLKALGARSIAESAAMTYSFRPLRFTRP